MIALYLMNRSWIQHFPWEIFLSNTSLAAFEIPSFSCTLKGTTMMPLLKIKCQNIFDYTKFEFSVENMVWQPAGWKITEKIQKKIWKLKSEISLWKKWGVCSINDAPAKKWDPSSSNDVPRHFWPRWFRIFSLNYDLTTAGLEIWKKIEVWKKLCDAEG